MEFLLYLVAIILFIPLTVINLIVVGVKYSFKWNILKGYFRETALDIDIFGNKNFRTLLNTTLITKQGYQFGQKNETISSVLGKNYLTNTLTTTGKLLVKILTVRHVIDSIAEWFMKLLVMLLLSTVCFSQIKINKQSIIYKKDTLCIIDKKILYKDTILYLDNNSSIRISKNLLYYYSDKVYLKFKFNKKSNKYLKLWKKCYPFCFC